MGGFNGSGTFTNASAAFVPNTPISSSAMNANFAAIATDGLSLVVCKDGQTTITGAFKGANGSVGLPMYSFASDTNTGMYRIGADNLGLSAGGTKILDIATTGLAVTGTFSSTGAYSPAGAILAADGTVLLPEYSFTSDPDSGIYRIGANNIGVAVNAAKVLDIGTAGLNVIGTVSSNGAAFSPTAQAAGMVNGTIVETHGASAVTFAIKTLAGADPSATDIVYFVFRNATAATGNYVVLQVTAALSLTVSSGSTLGTASSNVPFRLWLVAFNDASTVRLGIINTVLGAATPTSVYPLGQFLIASSTAEGGAGGADSAQVFYTGSAVASKAYSILGYASYETGVTTAGTWAASPTRLQLFGDGVPLPGQTVQKVFSSTTTSGTVTNTNFTALSPSPSVAITLSSAANLVRLAWSGTVNTINGVASVIRAVRSSTQVGVPTSTGGTSLAAGNEITTSQEALDAPGVTSATTYSFQAKSSSGTVTFPSSSTGTNMTADEIMT